MLGNAIKEINRFEYEIWIILYNNGYCYESGWCEGGLNYQTCSC